MVSGANISLTGPVIIVQTILNAILITFCDTVAFSANLAKPWKAEASVSAAGRPARYLLVAGPGVTCSPPVELR